jgi:hypothetical protein
VKTFTVKTFTVKTFTVKTFTVKTLRRMFQREQRPSEARKQLFYQA